MLLSAAEETEETDGTSIGNVSFPGNGPSIDIQYPRISSRGEGSLTTIVPVNTHMCVFSITLPVRGLASRSATLGSRIPISVLVHWRVTTVIVVLSTDSELGAPKVSYHDTLDRLVSTSEYECSLPGMRSALGPRVSVASILSDRSSGS